MLDGAVILCITGVTVFQVLSGGVVLELTSGQQVWLESIKENQRDNERNDVQQKQIIFNGFLLFENSE